MLKYKPLIEENYNLKISHIQQIQGGWSALAYRIISENGNFFLKAFDKHRHTTKECVHKIDDYMPVVMALAENRHLCEKISVPILTVSGKYKVENDDFVFIVFPFIDGETPKNHKLSEHELGCLAEIISELHSYRETDFSSFAHKETFDASICEKLLRIMNQECLSDIGLCDIFSQYKSFLLNGIAEIKRLSEDLRRANLDFTLCHTDLHGWNILLADKLILLDWEGLKLAPAEADLFAFSEGFILDYAWKHFFASYKKARPNYYVNQNAITFYRLHRRLEDIFEFAESILFDGLSEEDIIASLDCLNRECSALSMDLMLGKG